MLTARIAVCVPYGKDDKGVIEEKVDDDGFPIDDGKPGIPIVDESMSLGSVGGTGFDLGILSRKITHDVEAICLDGQAGIRYFLEDSKTKYMPGLMVYLNGELSFKARNIRPHIKLQAVMIGDRKYNGTKVDDSGIFWIETEVGVSHTFFETLVLKGGINYKVFGMNTIAAKGLLISLRRKF